MKKPMYKIRFRLISAALGLASSLLAMDAKAAAYYFHQNGTATDYGIVANTTYPWDTGTPWATAATAAPTVAFPATASDAHFNSSTTPYTVSLNSTQNLTGLFVDTATTVNLNDAGSGTSALNFAAGQWGVVFASSASLVVNAQITGAGQIWPENSGGTLYLFGTNTYTGGTHFGVGSPLVYFNNSKSFGSGTVDQAFSATTIGLLGFGGAPITLSNYFAFTGTGTGGAGAGFNFAASASTPVTLYGNWNLGTVNNIRIIQNAGGGSSPLTVHGVISGTATSLNLQANNSSTIVLDGASTYTCKTIIKANSSGVTVSVGGNPANLAFNKVVGGSPSSNLGAPTTAANGTISIGSTTFTCTLAYTGAGETTDRIIDLAGTTGGANLEADGTGALVFTSPFTASVAGAKKLTLQGTSTANNTIGGKVVDSSSGATALVKAQAGTWVLSGTNTYTGGTTVTGGTLDISATGVVVGNVTNSGGTLKLDANTCLSSSATVSANSGNLINLNFSGQQNITALFIDGAQQTSGTWGSTASGAAHVNDAVFTGTGKLNVLGSPVVVQQPVSITTYPDTNVSFTVVAAGDPSFLYQWYRNNAAVPSATDATYTFMAEAANAGTYFCAITNNFGHTNSANAVLTILATNAYVNVIRGDQPISYWRLDETNGTVAVDGINGNNGGYVNARLGQPSFSLTDPDTSVGLPLATGNRGYVAVTNVTPFNFTTFPFSLETWAYFTNVTAKARMISTLHITGVGGYAFGIVAGGTALEYTAGGIVDRDTPTLANPLVPGVWYHLVLTSDGGTYTFYVNGAPVGTGAVSGAAPSGSQSPMNFGCNPVSYTNNTAGDPLGEQLNGRLDEIAIYGYNLSQDQVTNHFNARYAALTPPVAATPIASPGTNYVSTTNTTIQEFAGGQALAYQWYHGATAVSGATDATLALPNLQLSDAGSYSVVVTNPAGMSTSSAVSLTVLPIPTSPTDLSLTNGLVLHLQFENNTLDTSGHNNNGTNVGSTSFVPDGEIGTNALHYSSDAGSSSFNYVTLGVRPDLKFSSNVNFTVSYWIRQTPVNTVTMYTNLPFFTDAIGSTGNGGYAFAPYATASTWGGWSWTFGSTSSTGGPTDANLINDGTWHHLVHVGDRLTSMSTYLDGALVESKAISFIGDTDNANATTIGQDPTGAYPVTAEADIDDVGVWRRTLTPLEVTGVFLAGVSNHVTFAPPITSVPATSVTISNISGTTLTYGGGSGSQFILLSSPSVAAALNTWTRVHTNTSSPGTFTIPAVGSGGPTFYSIQSQ